jgi:hypothetical protein
LIAPDAFSACRALLTALLENLKDKLNYAQSRVEAIIELYRSLHTAQRVDLSVLSN